MIVGPVGLRVGPVGFRVTPFVGTGEGINVGNMTGVTLGLVVGPVGFIVGPVGNMVGPVGLMVGPVGADVTPETVAMEKNGLKRLSTCINFIVGG